MAKVGSVALMNEAVFRAYHEMVHRRKKAAASDHIFNREVARLHGNTTLADLDTDFKNDVNEVSSALMAYINFMGFKLVPKD